MHGMSCKALSGALGLLVLSVITPQAMSADVIEQAVQANLAAQQKAEQSQQHIDGLSGETRTLADEYRLLLRQIDETRAYNDQLEILVAKQKAELDTYGAELTTAQQTRARSLPLLREMLRTLEEFVNLDMPFLATERRARVDDLKALLDAPDATLAEKFRRMFEAYRVEADYGHDIEASSEEVSLGGNKRTVEVLRVGRVALLYLSFDHAETGYWDQRARVWRKLPPEFTPAIVRGVQVARKQAPPELLALPLLTPERKP
jgi:hypothetical protein